ncbi:MAG: type I-E CRISPR-associated protein Cas7/Cse4/CasC [Desulfobulbaceae bacterium]|nr:type I-E CRISPR-associated protein Cas7/Cse4/CasC [Desulfobulbaceae bacterium]
MMSRFIQLHLLTAYPPSNLNRDDQGSPKTAKMGGYDRLRVSSQCLKRTWRTSEIFKKALKGHIGTRTKEMGLKIYNRLADKGIKHKDAIEWTKSIAGVFGKLKALSKKEKEALKELTDEKREKELVEVEIEQLVFFDTTEADNIFSLTERVAERNEGPNAEELNLLRNKMTAVDIAMFGRMLASSPAYNIEAACQVAHAISVHPVVVEDDYFTAVDDLNSGMEDMGAAHIGETRFAAGLFYSYICINRELLIQNLDGNEELANKAIRALTEAAVKVAPEGKQNSFASRAYASYVMAEKGDQQPRSLSVAYLKPINHRDNDDFINDSIDALIEQKNSFDQVYGKCGKTHIPFEKEKSFCKDCGLDHYEMNVPKRQGSLSELLAFVGK